MSFLRIVAQDPLPILRSARLLLRPPVMADHPAWADLRARSRAFLEPWEPLWPGDDLEKPAFRRRLRRYGTEMREGSAFPWFVFDAGSRELLGGVTLAQIRRGVTQTGTLGYWMGAPHAGRGIMTEAVGLVVVHAFATLRLHRIEASCLPENDRSIRLLEKVGFTREGLARRYLCIAGEWRDHILWGLLADDSRHPTVPRDGTRA
ncbi:MAG: GNAT family N-acetyltransferase [Siculibacillus sp.]|nr:GNAT family N-acetyltransferase [Siculibacillus sp.]